MGGPWRRFIMSGQDESRGGLSSILVALLMYGACHVAEFATEQLLPSEEVWIYGTCYDYFDNQLHCRPDDEHPGAGLTVGSGHAVWSSGCFGECEALQAPVSYRKAPYNLDTWAAFAASLGVLIGVGTLVRRFRGRAEERDELDDPSTEGPA